MGNTYFDGESVVELTTLVSKVEMTQPPVVGDDVVDRKGNAPLGDEDKTVKVVLLYDEAHQRFGHASAK